MTMKNLITLTLVLAFGQAMMAQNENFRVVKVNGTMFNATQKQNITTGNQVSKEDKVEFADYQNSAFVISKDNGRFLMAPEKTLATTAGSVLKPLSLRTPITTRAGSEVEMPENDLFKYFGKNNFVFLDGKSEVMIDINTFQLNDDKKIVARYKDASGKEISKKVKVEGNRMMINLDSIFMEKNADGSPKVYPMDLYLFDEMTKSLTRIAGFNPVYVKSSGLDEEIKIILAELKESKSRKEIEQEVETYVTEIYGEVSHNELRNFLNSRFPE
jgi:hypothetical protein